MESHPGLTTSFARKYQAGGRALSSFIFERLPVIADDQADPAASKIKSM